MFPPSYPYPLKFFLIRIDVRLRVFVHFTGRTIREAEGGVKQMKMKRGMRR
jgi:hypothetical protein